MAVRPLPPTPPAPPPAAPPRLACLARLAEHTAAGVRTGFVVPGFAQAIDEVVMNAVDAGARCVDIVVDFTSLSFSVMDDGCGIPESDFPSLGVRYATSKTRSSTLFGFRGEALASIAFFSRSLEIVSKTAASWSETARVLLPTGEGRTLDACRGAGSEIPGPSGTKVRVNDVFCRFPARRKHVSIHNEREKLRDMIVHHSLVSPGIQFALRDLVRPEASLRTPRLRNRLACIAHHFGTSVASLMQPMEARDGEASVSGHLGFAVAETLEPRCRVQMLFVNGRWTPDASVCARFLSRHTRGHLRVPVFVLHVALPPEQTALDGEDGGQVSVVDWRPVLRCVGAAAQGDLRPALPPPGGPAPPRLAPRLLLGPGTTPATSRPPTPSEAPLARPHTAAAAAAADCAGHPAAAGGGRSVRELLAGWRSKCFVYTSLPRDIPSAEPPPVVLGRDAVHRLEFIAQVDRKFLLARVIGADLLVALDQHAVDERVRLEALEDAVRASGLGSLDIVRRVWPLSAAQGAVLQRCSGAVERWGWRWDRDAAARNPRAVVVTAVPLFQSSCLAEPEHFAEFLADPLLAEASIPGALRRLLASTACRSAIMFGDELAPETCRALLQNLCACRIPFQCAHGRPSIVPLARLGRTRFVLET